MVKMVKVMNTMNKAICNKCEHEFDIKLQTENKYKLQVTYFECPECNERYIVNVTDKKLRKDMKKAIKLRNRMISNVDDEEAIRDYHVIKEKNCAREKELREIYLKKAVD